MAVSEVRRRYHLITQRQRWDATSFFLQARDGASGRDDQGAAIGGDGLLQPRRAALTRTKRPERVAEIVLGGGPLERDAVAGVFLQGGAIGGDGLLQTTITSPARN